MNAMAAGTMEHVAQKRWEAVAWTERDGLEPRKGDTGGIYGMPPPPGPSRRAEGEGGKTALERGGGGGKSAGAPRR